MSISFITTAVLPLRVSRVEHSSQNKGCQGWSRTSVRCEQRNLRRGEINRSLFLTLVLKGENLVSA